MINHDPRNNKMETTYFFNNVEPKKNHTNNQPHQYAQNYFPSDDDEYYKQNRQRFSSNPRPRSYSIDQPDIFVPYTRN